MSELSNGQQKALQQVLLNYANNDEATSYEVICAITSILHCDGEETLRDQFAMAAMIADAIAGALIAISYLSQGKTYTGEIIKPEDGASEYYKTADALMEARK